jgi:hypothetical protein
MVMRQYLDLLYFLLSSLKLDRTFVRNLNAKLPSFDFTLVYSVQPRNMASFPAQAAAIALETSRSIEPHSLNCRTCRSPLDWW